MIVIADTTPLNYLVLIDRADLLSQLFGRVLIPPAVFNELKQPETSEQVRDWVAHAPSWLQVQSLRSRPDPSLGHLDSGEREAARRNLPFMGTLGVLRLAARLDMIDLGSDLARLQQTTFYVDPQLIRSLLEEDASRKKP